MYEFVKFHSIFEGAVCLDRQEIKGFVTHGDRGSVILAAGEQFRVKESCEEIEEILKTYDKLLWQYNHQIPE